MKKFMGIEFSTKPTKNDKGIEPELSLEGKVRKFCNKIETLVKEIKKELNIKE